MRRPWPPRSSRRLIVTRRWSPKRPLKLRKTRRPRAKASRPKLFLPGKLKGRWSMDRRPFSVSAADCGTVRRPPLFSFPQGKEARMQGENEQNRDASDGSGDQPTITPGGEPNPAGQDG